LYIIPPEVSDYAHFTPTISNSIYNGGATGCSQIVPGVTTGTFSFDTESKGRFQLICDLNHDTVFDISNDDDLMLIDEMLPGPNSIAWDGRNRSGEPVPFDTYQCQIRAVVGEAHYVSFDVETSFEGMRMYEVAYDHSRTPLPIYWNDTDVQHPDPMAYTPALTAMQMFRTELAIQGMQGLGDNLVDRVREIPITSIPIHG